MFNPKFNWLQGQPLPSYIENGKFLPNFPYTFFKLDPDNPHVRLPDKEWSGADSPEAYKRNLQTQPANWRYRTKKIYYESNSNGYRAPEWDTIDWANAVVIFGCSMVAGTGLAEDETLTVQLSEILHRPVVNLGVGGSSINFAFHNNLVLDKHFPTPWAVVNMWTTHDRMTVYKHNETDNIGPWDNENKTLFGLRNLDPNNAIIQARMLMDASKRIWEPKTRYYTASFFEETAYYLESDFFTHLRGARDLIHPGPRDVFLAARAIAEKLS